MLVADTSDSLDLTEVTISDDSLDDSTDTITSEIFYARHKCIRKSKSTFALMKGLKTLITTDNTILFLHIQKCYLFVEAFANLIKMASSL